MIYRSKLLYISSFLFLSGCAASLPATLGGTCYNKTLPMLLDSTELKPVFSDIARDLCTETCSDCSEQVKEGETIRPKCANGDMNGRPTVLVTDFADIQSFLPNQSGLLMGELMRGSLNSRCCNRIVQAEFAQYFKLSENGLRVLTRNANEIKKDEYSQSDVIVGTYSYLDSNKVLIFVRKINTGTGIISRMVTREINYTCGARSVLGYSVK